MKIVKQIARWIIRHEIESSDQAFEMATSFVKVQREIMFGK